jgi:peptide/nickel transport system substrate-binding protein
VRRALALALDHYSGSKAMLQFTAFNVVGGLLRPGSDFARSAAELQSLPGFSRDIEASRKEARRLLAEAGHPNLKLTFLNNGVFSYFGVYMVDQLRQIGVTLDHQAVDGPTFQARSAAGNYDMVFRTPPEYLDDPTVNWSTLKPFKDNAANYTHMDDPKFDEMYEAQKRTIDPKERRARLREMESYLLNQAYVIPLFWHNWTRAISSDVQGVGSFQSTFMKLDLADIWLKPAGTPKP